MKKKKKVGCRDAVTRAPRPLPSAKGGKIWRQNAKRTAGNLIKLIYSFHSITYLPVYLACFWCSPSFAEQHALSSDLTGTAPSVK